MPELRRPTDRTEAFAEWRRRLAGERITGDDTPRCGLYRARRNGVYVAVQIDLVQEIDESTGELLSDETFVAFIGRDTFYDQDRIADIWLRCCGNPITEIEFERLQQMPRVSDLSREVIV